jgi:hypothetical protein
MLTIMGIAARTHGFNIDGTKAEITKIMESNPRRVGEIIIHLYFPPQPSAKKKKQIIQHSAFTCPFTEPKRTT